MKSRQFLISQIELLQQYIQQHLSLSIKIGAELEFYLKADSQKQADIIADALSTREWSLEKEKGWRQYECVFDYKQDIPELIEQINGMQTLAKSLARQNDCRALFDSKPYFDDYGSAFHLHISLHDTNGFNIFSSSIVEETDKIGKFISGLLDISAESVYLLCRDPQDYLRFTPKFLSPTHIAWGSNNRTTIIRIPNSLPKHKRIEFRLPPASVEPAIAIYVVLIGIIHGLSNNIKLPTQIHGNAFDDIYALTPLPKSLSEAKNIFDKSGKILHYTNKLAPKLILDDYL